MNLKGWPLREVGDEMFFGYINCVGYMPHTQKTYAKFTYQDVTSIYLVPNDEDLIEQLLYHLRRALWELRVADSSITKVWIKKTLSGYEVFLP